MVQRTVVELSKLSFEIPWLTLTWIKAHVGHKGYELADKAAKHSSVEPTISIKGDIPISKTEISNRQIYKKLHSKLLLSKPDTKRAKQILQLPCLEMKHLVEIITGHNNQ